MGGNGDCGFRSRAAARSVALGQATQQFMTQEQARLQGATIRTQCLTIFGIIMIIIVVVHIN